jgi:hypothetical protein
MREMEHPSQAMMDKGPAAAAFLSAGIGSFTLGLLTLLGRYAGFVAPNLYAPVGNLTGKVGIALLAWLVSWVGLHLLWTRKDRSVDLGKIFWIALALVGFGLLATFVPFLLRR